MQIHRTKLESSSKTYLEKAKSFSDRDAELLTLRLGGRFTHRAEDKSRNPTEIVALQLAFEDRQLNEWRDRLTKVRERESTLG